MQSRAGVKNITVIRDCNGQEPTIVRDAPHGVSTSYPEKAQAVWIERSDDRKGGRARVPH
jgi:hypothetical protein